MTDAAEPVEASERGVEPGRLYVCAVPIGNLEDASPHLVRVLGAVDAVACEDTRTTGRLLELIGVSSKPRLLAHHDHNERASAEGIVALLREGAAVALVSDAGTPAVSDPGAVLVDAVLAAGFAVEPVAGPSALAAAMSVSGIVSATCFRFVGFMPRKAGEVERLLRAGAHEVLVAYEAPTRLVTTLVMVAEHAPERGVVVCRELTKRHGEVVRGTAAELLELWRDEVVRGEVVLVFDAEPAVASTGVDARHVALVEAMAQAGVRSKEAARIVAAQLGGSARELYEALHGH